MFCKCYDDSRDGDPISGSLISILLHMVDFVGVLRTTCGRGIDKLEFKGGFIGGADRRKLTIFVYKVIEFKKTTYPSSRGG